jgi:hypothetical protein
LIRRQHRVDGASSAGDDRIQLRLNLTSHGPQLPALSIHDRIDSLLLRRREAQLVSKPVPESAVPRRPSGSSFMPTGPAEHVGQEQQPVYRHTRKPAGEGDEQQHQRGKDWSIGAMP